MLDIAELNGLERRQSNQKVLVLSYAAPVGLKLATYTKDDMIKRGNDPVTTLAVVASSLLHGRLRVNHINLHGALS